MDNKIKNAIDGFLTELKELYPNIIIEVSEIPYDNTILIYHNYIDSDSDEAFNIKNIELQNKYFWNNNIINIGFAFGYQLYKSLLGKKTTNYDISKPNNIQTA